MLRSWVTEALAFLAATRCMWSSFHRGSEHSAKVSRSACTAAAASIGIPCFALIGSMNDAVGLIRFYDGLAGDEGVELDLVGMEHRSNETPYKALGFEYPRELLARMLGK